MNDEIREALDRWVLTVDKCIHDHTDLITKMSGNIIDHQVAINNLERRIEHIETYIDPIKDFTERPVTASKGGSEDDNIN